jgi:flagellar biosynthesis chaperone FliJ
MRTKAQLIAQLDRKVKNQRREIAVLRAEVERLRTALSADERRRVLARAAGEQDA